MPSIVALSGFFIDNFPTIAWYPYWYLGNPFSYLIGPVVPVMLMIFSGIVPMAYSGQALYHIYLGLIILSVLAGGIGIYLLVGEWEENKIKNQKSKIKNNLAGLIAGLLYILFPFSWLGLYYQNGLKIVAFALVPFVFIVYRRFLNIDQISNPFDKLRTGLKSQIHSSKLKTLFSFYLLLVLLIAVCLLITINILLAIVIGIAAIFITEERLLRRALSCSSRNDNGLERLPRLRQLADPRNDNEEWREEMIVKTIVILGIGLFLSTFWYTPRFWLVILTNPSFGGVPLWNVIVNIFQSALNLLPLGLAIVIVKWRSFLSLNMRGGVFQFALLFFLSFFFLTAARFLADPDFVIDWIGFLPELQFGLSMIGGVLITSLISIGNIDQKLKIKDQNYNLKLKNTLIKIFVFTLGVVCTIISSYLIYNLFVYAKSDYQNEIVSMIQPHVRDKNMRVFLSGSDVFWINMYLPVSQVRGGFDGASIHPYWAHGAYQIREGEDARLDIDWLRIFGAQYVLVHQADSRDVFHDFKHPDKFKDLELLADKNGDKLYKVPSVWMVRVMDESVLSMREPKNDADARKIGEYVDTFRREARYKALSANKISIDSEIAKGEVINLAITYDMGWKILEGRGKISGDAFGNIVIVPDKMGEQKFILSYVRDSQNWIIISAVLFLSLFLVKYKYIYPKLRRRMPKIHAGFGREDDY